MQGRRVNASGYGLWVSGLGFRISLCGALQSGVPCSGFGFWTGLGPRVEVVDRSWEESGLGPTHRPHSSSFLGLPYRILHMNPKRNYYGAYG